MELISCTSEHHPQVHKMLCEQNPRYQKTFEQFEKNEKHQTKKVDGRAFVVVQNGKVVAFIKTHNVYFDQKRKKNLCFEAVPTLQNDNLIGFIREVIKNSPMDGYKLGTSEYEDREWKVDIIKTLGLEEISRGWRSSVDLQTFEFNVNSIDLEIVNLSELLEWGQEKALAGINDLQNSIVKDIPMPYEWEDRSLEDFKKVFFDIDYVKDCSFFAVKDEELIAQSTVGHSGEKDASVFLTGAKKEFRKQGISTYLKYLSMMKLKEMGFQKLFTFNDSINNPMLNLNTKMGFQRDGAAMITFEEL